MRRRTKTRIVVGGTAIALATGGGISAWADWDTGAQATTMRTTVSQVPLVGKPKVEKSGNKPKVAWDPPETGPFDGYVVVRRNGSLSRTVCTVAAPGHACADQGAPAGATVTYVVRATTGATWTGPDSEPSEPFLVPRGPKEKTLPEADAAPPIEQPAPTAEQAPAPDVVPDPPTREPTPTPTREPTEETTESPPAPIDTTPASDVPVTTEPADTDLPD
jgi:hypothetical protein